ncbi:MAG: mechanosensitive ion channel family protein [Actinomycetota bacterium]
MEWWERVEELWDVWLIRTAIQVAFVLLIAFVLTRLLRRITTKVGNKVSKETTPIRALQRTETLTRVLSSAGIVVIWVLSTFYIVGALGANLAPLLASVGIIGLAVGFGAQNLVRDVVSGFFILLEDQYGVGDIIEINQVASGKVETLTLRVTGMRALDGTMHFIANGEITHIANRSKDWARAVIDVGVAYKESSEKVRRTLERVALEAKENTELGHSMYAAPEILGVEMLGEYEVTWRVIVDTKPGKQWDVGRSLRERIKAAFDEDNIEIPFPHQVMISAEDNGSKARVGT